MGALQVKLFLKKNDLFLYIYSMKNLIYINLFSLISLQNDTIKLIKPLYPDIESIPAFSFTVTTSNLILFTIFFIVLQLLLAKYLFSIKNKYWKVILPFNFFIIKELFKFKFLKAFISFIFIFTNELIKYLIYIHLIIHIYHNLF